VRFNWHTLSHRYQTDFSYFGMSRYVIDFGGEHQSRASWTSTSS
jgi:benzoate/toluate 1,2-dioxygenase beta subunit